MADRHDTPATEGLGERGGPSRADARRNRARVLAAAEEVFAARGVSASTEEVARAAGVGIGTVFRHFPTKEALLEAVFVARLHRLTADAAALAAADDPGVAFFAFFARVAEHAATKHAFADALAAAGIAGGAQEAVARVRQEVHRAVDLLLGRAQRAGAVRADLRAADLLALLVGAARSIEHAGSDRDMQARVLAVILDGLRPAAGR